MLLWNVGYIFFPVILMSYFFYHIIKSFCKVKVNCWFCDEDVRVPYNKRKAFFCPNCGQYNGFKEDGDYDRFIPAQRYEHLNPAPTKKVNGKRKISLFCEKNADNGLCQQCNMQQAYIQTQINRFEPRNEANFEYEFKEYKERLHRIHPLCSDCERFVQKKLKQDKEITIFNGHVGSFSARFSPRCSQDLQKQFSESNGIWRNNCTHRRRRAALFNCGPISNCLNLITFALSCSLFMVYIMELLYETNDDLLNITGILPEYLMSPWISFLMLHIPKLTCFGLCLHIISVAVMRARRSLPDIVAFFIWCALSLLSDSNAQKQELFLSQLSFSSILCIVSFAVAFLPRKLLHRKRPNSIIESAFSIASTPVSQCSTLSARTSSGKDISFSGSTLERTTVSRENTPSRELGTLFNSLSLGSESTPSKRMPALRKRRGPFDSMKKPILAEPRLRLQDTRDELLLNKRGRLSSRYVMSCEPSTITSVSTIRHDAGKYTLFNVFCMLGTLLSLALNAAMYYKLFYSSKS